MTDVRVTLLECYGDYEPNSEEVCWGPYPMGTFGHNKSFDQLEPSDFMLDGWTPEDVIYDENYLSWDTTQEIDNGYVRFNYMAVTA